MSTTDKSILERVAARMKEIVGIAEAAAKHAMEGKAAAAEAARSRFDGRLTRLRRLFTGRHSSSPET